MDFNRAELLIAFAIISRYEKTWFFNRGCDYMHVTRESKEVCSTWRPIGVWHKSTARESIDVPSLIALAVLWWHTPIGLKSAASSRTHLSSLQRKHQVGTLTVLPSLRLASKNVIFSPWKRIYEHTSKRHMEITQAVTVLRCISLLKTSTLR